MTSWGKNPMYLFCQKKYPNSKIFINQRRHVAICRKEKCQYLIDGAIPECKCPKNLQNLSVTGFTRKRVKIENE